MKKLFFLFLCFTILLSACGSPTSPTEEVAENTEASTESATSVPEPTATLVPEPQIITADNVANLSFQGLVDLPRKPNLVWPYMMYIGDGQHLVLTTEAGIDILNAKTLEFEASYTNFYTQGTLKDGRLYGWHDNGVTFLDPMSGEFVPLENDALIGGTYTLNAESDKLAYVDVDYNLQLVDLSSGQTTMLTQPLSEPLTTLFFNSDSSVVIAYWEVGVWDGYYKAYDVNTGAELYNRRSGGPVKLLSDGQSILLINYSSGYEEFRNIVDDEYIGERSYRNEISTDIKLSTGYEKMYNFFIMDVLSDHKTAFVNYWNNDDLPDKLGLFDLEKNEVITMFPEGEYTARPEIFALAPDASAVATFRTDGTLEISDLRSGATLASSDRYTLSSQMAMSPDGNLIAWADFKKIYVYDIHTNEFIMEKDAPEVVSSVSLVDFVGQKQLLVGVTDVTFEEVFYGISSNYYIRTYVWDLSTGAVSNYYDLYDHCEAQDNAGTLMKCAVYQAGFIKQNVITTITNVNEVELSGNLETYIIGSPSGDGFASCVDQKSGITIKEGTAASIIIDKVCQPFFYGRVGDNLNLFLEDGTVVDVATGGARMQLHVDEFGRAFISGFVFSSDPGWWERWFYQYEEYYAGKRVHFFSGDGFFVINDRIFDAESGALLIGFPDIDTVNGITMSEDSKTLLLLTNRGLEQWQVLQ